MPVSAFVVAATVTLVAASPQDWSHSWSTALESQFIDYGYQTLTQQKAQFVATHYQIASFEKCTGPGPTEPNVWATAAQIKALNPSFKAMFYWDVDQTALSCYDAYNVFMANPSWWLRDDNGRVVNSSSGQPIMDYTNPAARDWWVSVPLNGTGSPASHLIDGVLADGAGRSVAGSGCYTPSSTISPARCDALVAGKSTMVQQLQTLFSGVNGGVVLGNGLSFYPSPPDHNFYIVNDSRGVMAEHFAVFEDVLPDGSLNVSLVAEYIDTVAQAAALGKVVVVGTWPGQLVTPFTGDGYPSWPNNSQPVDNAGWQAALLAKHTFALAGFLTMATETVYMQYEAWYNGLVQGAIPCPEQPSACSAPPAAEWYPALLKPLGSPLGPAVRNGSVWTRAFEHAVSVLNVADPDASSVTFTAL